MNRQLLIYYESLSNEALCKSALKDRDETAFRVLYDRTIKRLTSKAIMLHNGDREAAKDSLQKFWLNFLSTKPDIKDGFEAYATIAMNREVWENYRKQKSQQRSVELAKFETEEDLERSMPKKEEDSEEMKIYMTEEQQMVANLLIEGYSKGEIVRDVTNGEQILRKLKKLISDWFVKRKPPIL
ncbi:MAG: hypothetical protein IT258_23675 [Saprospiraceae bacterium]|nr:hypothetical protein [Saprospiraceae bacterium]